MVIVVLSWTESSGLKILYHSREKAKQLIVTSSVASSGTSGRPELSVHDSSSP